MKIDIKLTDRYRKKYLSLDTAYDVYCSARFMDEDCSKYRPNGFFTKKLNFGEWLDYFNIGIY